MNLSASPLRIITVGHVDHGKSTLLGRLLYDTNSLSHEQLASLSAASQAEGRSLEFAFVLDAFLEEQAENITIDITQIPLRSAERNYLLIDAPGHKEFLKNMLTGASSADAAILLVSVAEGLQEQTRRHVQLLALLGIHQIIVVINKLDLVHFSQEAFEQTAAITKKLFQEFQLPLPPMIPIAARLGENVATASSQMPWYVGATVLQALDAFTSSPPPERGPLRFVVQDVYHKDAKKEPLIVGRIESGSFRLHEELTFWPQGEENRKSRVKSIEVWGASSPPTTVTAGESIAITLEEPMRLLTKLADADEGQGVSGTQTWSVQEVLEDVSTASAEMTFGATQQFAGAVEFCKKSIAIRRGDIACTTNNPPLQSHRICVRLFWFEATALCIDQEVTLQLATQRISARVTSIGHVMDTTTLTSIQESPQGLHQHEVADVVFQLHEPLVYDYHAKLPATGRLAVALSKCLGGAGTIIPFSPQPNKEVQTPSHGTRKCHTASLHESTRPLLLHQQDKFGLKSPFPKELLSREMDAVARRDREKKWKCPGAIVWFTGLSGSGKSTLAIGLEGVLQAQGIAAYLLDGDNLRQGLCADLGFSSEDRTENIRRAGHVAKLFAEAGLVALCAFISPFRADRERIRNLCLHDHIPFMEIFVNAPLRICEQRDPRGLYAKVRRGEVIDFTGIDSPYEAPDHPELHLATDHYSSKESLQQLHSFVVARLKHSGAP